MWKTRHVDIVGGKIEEERMIAVFLDEVDGVGSDGVGDVLVFPQCLTATLHITDSADAVHDRHIVAVARLHIIAQLRIVLSGRFAREVL